MLRRRYRGAKGKYSNETTTVNMALTTPLAAGSSMKYEIVPVTNVYGTRKVKNFTLNLSIANFTNTPVVYALVYVPEGTSPSALTTQGNDVTEQGVTTSIAQLYKPNQNVIMQGIIVPGDPRPVIQKSRLARNLDSGDSICLLIANVAAVQSGTPAVFGTVNYAVKF